MGGLTELNGTLIQMSVHTQTSEAARRIFIASGMLAIIGILLTVAYLASNFDIHTDFKGLIVFILIFLLGCGGIWFGCKRPKEKTIYACANGPLSLEQVETVYDILEIDGKMLKLRER